MSVAACLLLGVAPVRSSGACKGLSHGCRLTLPANVSVRATFVKR